MFVNLTPDLLLSKRWMTQNGKIWIKVKYNIDNSQPSMYSHLIILKSTLGSRYPAVE